MIRNSLEFPIRRSMTRSGVCFVSVQTTDLGNRGAALLGKGHASVIDVFIKTFRAQRPRLWSGAGLLNIYRKRDGL